MLTMVNILKMQKCQKHKGVRKMRITDLLKKQGIVIGADVKDKAGAIDKLVELHYKCGNLNDKKAYKNGILKREEGGMVKLDDERKAAMVSNLLVVLCGNKDAQPVVNSGNLY